MSTAGHALIPAIPFPAKNGKTMETTIVVGALLLMAVLFIVSRLRSKTAGSHMQSGSLARSETRAQVDTPTPRDVPDLSMLPERFIVFDLETTGLNPNMHEIIEFGAIRVNRDANNHATFQALVKPERKVPKRITDLTGISQEMVDREGEPLAEVLAAFVEFIEDLPLVAFNAPFDMAFLQNAAKKQNLAIKNSHSCALEMARRAWPGLQSYRLTDLARMGHLSDVNTHRSLGDCQRAMIVYTAAASKLGAAKRAKRLS
jgi:DNA polymerase III epsilon subunit family exonuclease